MAVDPYPIFAELRAAEPVTWVPEIERWLLTRRDDILAVLRDPGLFTTDAPSTIRDMFGAHMMTTEGPAQVRYKRKCLPPFHASRLASASLPQLKAEVERLVAALGSGGRRTGEVRTGLARPVALHSVLSVLGMPLTETSAPRSRASRPASSSKRCGTAAPASASTRSAPPPRTATSSASRRPSG